MPKPKLTAQERRELKQQKKLNKKLQKEEKKRQDQRDHLEREIKYGQLSYKRNERDWKQMLTKVTLPRMRTELEFAWHNFERVIDTKEFTISLLLEQLRQDEEQSLLNFYSHLENIDKLIEMFKNRLDEFQEEFDFGLKQLEENWIEETETRKTINNENCNYVKTMLYQLEIAKREHERTKRAEFYATLDEVDVKNHMAIQKLKAHLEWKYQGIFNALQQFIMDYQKRIKDRKKEYNTLKGVEESMQELISQQLNKMRNLYDTVRKLRQKFGNMKQKEGQIVKDLQMERQFFSQSYMFLKQKLAKNLQNDFFKLATMGEECDKTFSWLQKLNEKGDKILTISGICRKFETEKEKVLAFPKNKLDISEDDRVYREEENECVELRKEMELFWQRVGRVYSVLYALDRERKYLTQENQLFINTHNDYCDTLEHPSIKKYRAKVAISRIDAKVEILKYRKEMSDKISQIKAENTKFY